MEMANFFQVLRDQQGKDPGAVAQFLSDHPAPANRQARIQEEVQEHRRHERAPGRLRPRVLAPAGQPPRHGHRAHDGRHRPWGRTDVVGVGAPAGPGAARAGPAGRQRPRRSAFHALHRLPPAERLLRDADPVQLAGLRRPERLRGHHRPRRRRGGHRQRAGRDRLRRDRQPLRPVRGHVQPPQPDPRPGHERPRAPDPRDQLAPASDQSAGAARRSTARRA